MKARVQGFVEAGRMTQEEADSVIVSSLHGQYRVKYREQIAARKAEEAAKMAEERQRQLERTSNTLDVEREEAEQLRTRNQAMLQQLGSLRDKTQHATFQLAHLFNKCDDITKGNHLSRNGINWPTEPSPVAFYLFYAIGVPIGSWPPDDSDAPDVKKAFHSVNSFLHVDKALGYLDALGGEEKLRDISAVLATSKEIVEKYIAENNDATEKQHFLNQCWETAKYRVLKAMRLNSNTIPPFFLSFLVDEAAAHIAKCVQK